MNDSITGHMGLVYNMGLFLASDRPVRVPLVYCSSCIADEVERWCSICHAAGMDVHSVNSVNTRFNSAYNETHNSTISRRALGVPEAHHSTTQHPKQLKYSMCLYFKCILIILEHADVNLITLISSQCTFR